MTIPARADDPTPHPFPPDRYNAMIAHSPFAPPTEAVRPPPTAPPPPVASWSDKLTVSNLMQDHGVFYAIVVDPDSPQHLYLSSATQDATSHLRIADVKWNHVGDREEPTVVLVKDNALRAPVRYDPGSGAGAVVGLPRPNGQPGLPGMSAPNAYHPPGAPVLPGAANPPPTSTTNLQRRAPIRAIPPPPAAGGAGRPVVLPGPAPVAQPVRPGPQQIKTDDDDDDD